MVEVKGFRVAFVAFTKGVGNLRLPEGAEGCVNLLYTDYNTTYQDVDTEGIRHILSQVQSEKPDIVIALLHWGSEYDSSVSKTQEEIRDLMLQGGVDVILGTHSLGGTLGNDYRPKVRPCSRPIVWGPLVHRGRV